MNYPAHHHHLLLPQGYFVWTDLTGLILAPNGLEKTGANGFNAAGRSVQEGVQGVRFTMTAEALAKTAMIQLMDASQATGTGFHDADPFTMYIRSTNNLDAYYDNLNKGNVYAGYVEGDVLDIRLIEGKVKILVNEAVVYTFTETPHKNMAARVCVNTSGMILRNIEQLS